MQTWSKYTYLMTMVGSWPQNTMSLCFRQVLSPRQSDRASKSVGPLPRRRAKARRDSRWTCKTVAHHHVFWTSFLWTFLSFVTYLSSWCWGKIKDEYLKEKYDVFFYRRLFAYLRQTSVLIKRIVNVVHQLLASKTYVLLLLKQI